MLERFKDSFIKGIERIKWFATLFSERLKIEIALMKLLYQSSEMDEKREDLFKTIGRRVYELKGTPDKNIFKDRAVLESVEGIEKLEKDMDDLKHRVSELSGAGV
jgi:hypothetical protein